MFEIDKWKNMKLGSFFQKKALKNSGNSHTKVQPNSQLPSELNSIGNPSPSSLIENSKLRRNVRKTSGGLENLWSPGNFERKTRKMSSFPHNIFQNKNPPMKKIENLQTQITTAPVKKKTRKHFSNQIQPTRLSKLISFKMKKKLKLAKKQKWLTRNQLKKKNTDNTLRL